MSEYELKPQELQSCPFCGSDVVYLSEDEGTAFVTCNSCCADGPYSADKEQAIAAWNTRAGGK